MAEKTKPHFDDCLAAESKVGSQGASALPDRLSRYSKAHQRAMHMHHHTKNIGEHKVSRKLKVCGDYLVFRHYYTVDKVRLHAASFCKQHLLCPLCAIRRGARYLKSYLEKFNQVMAENPNLKPYFVTFTVKDGPDLAERVRHLRNALQRQTVARRGHLSNPVKNRHVEAAKALGGVSSIEVKIGQNSQEWHPHSHQVWLCETPPDAFKLSEEWKHWTADSFIVDVRPLDTTNLAQSFCEVFKYALKTADLSVEDNWHAFKVLKGKRLVDSFGCMRGVEVSDDFTDDPLDEDLPYIELLYQYLITKKEGASYTLKKVTRSDAVFDPLEGLGFDEKKKQEFEEWNRQRLEGPD